MNAKDSLKHGQQFPFDAPDAWWDGDKAALPKDDWAVVAARGILADLRDRRDIKQSLQIYNIDEDVRAEIIQTLAAIIREAKKGGTK